MEKLVFFLVVSVLVFFFIFKVAKKNPIISSILAYFAVIFFFAFLYTNFTPEKSFYYSYPKFDPSFKSELIKITKIFCGNLFNGKIKVFEIGAKPHCSIQYEDSKKNKFKAKRLVKIQSCKKEITFPEGSLGSFALEHITFRFSHFSESKLF